MNPARNLHGQFGCERLSVRQGANGRPEAVQEAADEAARVEAALAGLPAAAGRELGLGRLVAAARGAGEPLVGGFAVQVGDVDAGEVVATVGCMGVLPS